MELGLYEKLINKLVENKLARLDPNKFYVQRIKIEKHEAARILSQYLSRLLHYAFGLITNEDSIDQQIALSNKIIHLLRQELDNADFDSELIDLNEKNEQILTAIISKIDCGFSDLEAHLKEVRPQAGLAQSELFTGGNASISLDTELRKEILSADKIYFLISFIKWEGFRLIEKELKEFTDRGGQLHVITTTYMGATDYKAIEFLAKLKNTQIKVSYNTRSERLHAKASLFYRNTKFHTAYIGSSNFSKSALTKGLEWNIKVTTQEIPHIIEKFDKVFHTYWNDPEFEDYHLGISNEKLQSALKKENWIANSLPATYFDLEPYPFQKEILEKLLVERTLHNRSRNLIVAATGTGKTVISAFDFKNFLKDNPNAKFLFIAHRKEILEQAIGTFRGILRDNNFGELWADGQIPTNYKSVFASILTLKNQIDSLALSSDYYDYIIIDEVHHISASSYRPVLSKFHPKVLLGLTATPERMDNANILDDFCNTIAAEIRLPEALNRELLCPFQYFGISDSIDLSNVAWSKGKYDPSELTRIYTGNDLRVGEIIERCQHYLTDLREVRALCFCVSRDHAEFMAEKFTLRGFKADYLVSGNDQEGKRETIKQRLFKKEINYLFVVDIFNEGVDIPEIDTILFLRPTESLTVFLQQLGRGLRKVAGKDCLTVLDFVGNARSEYDFNNKFRALIGKTTNSTRDEIEKDFPHLPLGCSIILERKAKEVILANIKNAVNLRKNTLISKIKNFQFQASLPLNLKNFINFTNIPLEFIYKYETWSRLCQLASEKKEFSCNNEKEIRNAIYRKWLNCNSYSYLNFILQLAKDNFNLRETYTESERLMLNMLYYDLWSVKEAHGNLNLAIRKISESSELVGEIVELLEILIDRIAHKEEVIDLPYQQPLMVHSRYTREQILAAFGESNFAKKSSSREGVLNINSKNTEILFTTLEKNEDLYSPTTMYQDYAVSDHIFHWQSQNASREDRGVGLSYIEQKTNKKSILLFVREKNNDEYKKTMSFVFLGKVNYVKHEGSKPMSIYWQLEKPIPSYLWKETAKLAIG